MKELNLQSILDGIGKVFNFCIYIDMSDGSYYLVKMNDIVQIDDPSDNVFEFLRQITDAAVGDDFAEEIRAWADYNRICRALETEEIVIREFKNSTRNKWIRGFIMAVDRRPDGTPAHVVCGGLEVDEEKRHQIARELELEEIHDAITAADMGIWRILYPETGTPRMYADDNMQRLLGIERQNLTPEETYLAWFERIAPEAMDSVIRSVGRMKLGYRDENTYLWNHPLKGPRYVRCGGTAQETSEGLLLKGYHYDVDPTVREEIERREEVLRQYEILDSMTEIYTAMNVVDFETMTVRQFDKHNHVVEYLDLIRKPHTVLNTLMIDGIPEEMKQSFWQFTDLSTLAERMQGEKEISSHFYHQEGGWFRAQYIRLGRDLKGDLRKVVYTINSIDKYKRRELQLEALSNTDELTGLWNRHAYEEDIVAYRKGRMPEDLIYVSMDVNNLKETNDNEGHETGDQVIKCAAECMKEIYGPYGRIYRTGGDEFVGLLRVQEDLLPGLMQSFREKAESKVVPGGRRLSIAVGCAGVRELRGGDFRSISELAEQRMYRDKSLYYRKTGQGRRGQEEAIRVLAESFTKVLRANLTRDSYSVVSMEAGENILSDKLSIWLQRFAEAGYVHPEDREYFLRSTDLKHLQAYFRSGKADLNITYRRMAEEGGYKRHLMVLLPTGDYTHTEQTLFLYTKTIEESE